MNQTFPTDSIDRTTPKHELLRQPKFLLQEGGETIRVITAESKTAATHKATEFVDSFNKLARLNGGDTIGNWNVVPAKHDSPKGFVVKRFTHTERGSVVSALIVAVSLALLILAVFGCSEAAEPEPEGEWVATIEAPIVTPAPTTTTAFEYPRAVIVDDRAFAGVQCFQRFESELYNVSSVVEAEIYVSKLAHCSYQICQGFAHKCGHLTRADWSAILYDSTLGFCVDDPNPELCSERVLILADRGYSGI